MSLFRSNCFHFNNPKLSNLKSWKWMVLKVSGTPRKVRQLPANFGVIPVTFWEPFIFSSSNSKKLDYWSENNLIWRETFHTNRVFCVFHYMRNNEDYVPKKKLTYPKTDMLKIQRRLSVPPTAGINDVLSLFVYKLRR